MTSPLPAQIHANPGSPASVRVGVVDSITGGVTVSVQGTVMRGVGLLGSYAPRPGDSVILLGQSSEAGADPASWVALGASQQQPQGQLLITQVQRNSVQNISNNMFTPISWDGVVIDNMGAFPSGSSTDLVAPFDGWYELAGRGSFVANAVGQRQGLFFRNGGSTESFVNANAAGALGSRYALPNTFLELVAGDAIQMLQWHNSGAATLATETAVGTRPTMTMRYLGLAG